ncbi:MAG: HEAT repeat domain-containing protein [Elainellaceae cyanobacterium]
MSRRNFEDTFQKIEEEYTQNDKPSSNCTKLIDSLAEEENPKIKDFLIKCLQDSRNLWKFLGLDMLLSHYDCKGNSDVIEKVRSLLLNDEDPAIRSKSAAFLGVISKWPDPALRDSLTDDEDSRVIVQAFQAILLLAGIPYNLARQEVNRLKAGQIEPNFESIEHITQNYADSLKGH